MRLERRETGKNYTEMKVYIGADHRGFELKQGLVAWLKEEKIEHEDVGALALVSGDDYVDYAARVARMVSDDVKAGVSSRGVLICGTGIGVDIVANKFMGVRSGLCYSKEQVGFARNDDDINVLSLAADYLSPEEVWEMVKVFLNTPFSEEERHKRRLLKIREFEE